MAEELQGMAPGLVAQLNASREFFDRGTRGLEEGDSGYAPSEGMFTAAQQVAHVAQVMDWFVEGARRPEGFDMNFEEHMKPVIACVSLDAAREWLNRACNQTAAYIAKLSDAELTAPLPEGPVMGGAPRMAVVGGLADHAAHHRGVLSVYTRLLGKVPPMPYMDL